MSIVLELLLLLKLLGLLLLHLLLIGHLNGLLAFHRFSAWERWPLVEHDFVLRIRLGCGRFILVSFDLLPICVLPIGVIWLLLLLLLLSSSIVALAVCVINNL